MQFGQKIKKEKKTPWTVKIYQAVCTYYVVLKYNGHFTCFSSFEYYLITSLDFTKEEQITCSILSLWFESGLLQSCFSSCFAFTCMDTEIKSRIYSSFFQSSKTQPTHQCSIFSGLLFRKWEL